MTTMSRDIASTGYPKQVGECVDHGAKQSSVDGGLRLNGNRNNLPFKLFWNKFLSTVYIKEII